MTFTRLSETIHEWLGWCPNHSVTAAPQVKMKIGPGIYIIALICMLAVPAVVLLTSPGTPECRGLGVPGGSYRGKTLCRTAARQRKTPWVN